MSRVIKTIEIEGNPVKALFDAGTFHTFILQSLVETLPNCFAPVSMPYSVSLCGETFEVRELALINGKIQGLDFSTSAIPVRFLVKMDGYELDAIIGRITMDPWEIKVNPADGSLDLEGLRRRTFTEYSMIARRSIVANQRLSRINLDPKTARLLGESVETSILDG